MRHSLPLLPNPLADPDAKLAPLHSYIIIRHDIPLAAALAQTAHAAQEAAFLLDRAPPCPIHIVVLSCKDEPALLDAAERLGSSGFDPRLFHEPDWPRGYTALFLRPQERSGKLRSSMGRYPLWQAPSFVAH